ncbi:hypothetical protein [Kamptonema formosum]|uniref:hypothetical protein n=1 Tax=Kamptonema formosum TaxID=331992 RepID=UPI0012DC0642|nr:hypothetical protein [Oscillatoria sp. PCC 10802]
MPKSSFAWCVRRRDACAYVFFRVVCTGETPVPTSYLASNRPERLSPVSVLDAAGARALRTLQD